MAARSTLREGDYVSPNLSVVALDSAFPNMIAGDKVSNRWPYLRREIAHNWYVDRRNPTVGFLSRDEAVLLHNIALLHAGKPCLEIGCWRGWSTAHMALGAGNLEVIDPVLADPDFRDDVAASLRRAGVLDSVVLHGAASPNAVVDLSEGTGKRWSLIFIDGDHEGDAPRLDAEAVHRYAAAAATIVLHDLTSPHVAAALIWLRDHGWRTAIYQTMQIMGIAVRGSDRIPPHQPDPSQRWTVPEHLMSMPIIGEPRGGRIARLLAWFDGSAGPHAPAGASALDHLPEEEAAAVDDLLARLAARQAAPIGLVEAFDALQTRHTALMDRLAAIEWNPVGPDQFDRLQAQHVQTLERLAHLDFREADAQVKVAAAQEALEAARAAATAETERARAVAAERDVATGLLDRMQLKYVQTLKQLGDAEAREAALQQQALAAARREAQLQQALAAARREAELQQALAAARRETAPAPRPVQQNQRAAIDEAAYWLAQKRILFGLSRRVLAGRTAKVRQLVEDLLRRAGLPESTIARAAWVGAPRVVLGLAWRRLLAGKPAVQGLLVLELERAAGPDLWAEMTDTADADRLRAELGTLEGQLAAAEQRFAALEVAKLQDEQRFAALEAAKLQDERRFAALEAAKLQDERALLEADLALAQLRARLTGRAA